MSKWMSYRVLKDMYTASPAWMQKMYAKVPFDWRAGRIYRDVRALVRRTERLQWEELEALQCRRLRQLLIHAGTNTPFYSKHFEKEGFRVNVDSESVWSVFRALPLIEKQRLQECGEQFLATGGVGEATYRDNTGGSSGTPFGFIKNNKMYPVEQAYMLEQWSRVGYRPGDAKLVLRGRTFSGKSAESRWSHNPIYNELVLSSYHLDAETVSASWPAVKRFRPKFIHGYPSAIVAYLKNVSEAGLGSLDGIMAVLCGSEPVYEYQRQYMQDVLGSRVYSWYGQSECVLMAGECEYSQDYHSFPLYGVLELVDENGSIITEPGVEGEIVGTSLCNTAMPFIRYCTADRGVYAPFDTCECGRSYRRLQRVTGRRQHYVYTQKGNAVPVTAFVFGQHFGAFGHICAMQLQQDEPGKLIVRVVQGHGYSEQHEREIRGKMESAVDGEISVLFDYTERLAVNNAGKTDFVIQNVKRKPC